jgi:hypothetical protein
MRPTLGFRDVLTGRHGPRILTGMDWDGWVLRSGDRVSVRGRLVRTAHGTWLDPPVAVPAVLIRPVPVRPPSRAAVVVSGADFSRVDQRYELDGDIEGSATVGGV